MRTFLTRSVLGVLGTLLVVLAACTDPGAGSAREQALQQKADYWEILQIEEKFHQATTTKDIDLMMSLWAPSATLTVGPGQTAAGIDQIREFWLEKSDAFLPTNNWISDHPAWKVHITVNGDRGTLHFECHYVDAVTKEVVLTTAADQDVARINGEWMITDMVAGSAPLSS